ncbi:MAG TPA: DUF2304 domain-containing protein [Microbacteriaceae bacterium]|nr:DUF2304 domain-containing protein [Microbacteriaceae bacterium]
MSDQIVIKILLVAAFVVFGIVLLRPGRSARNKAIRAITLLVLLACGVFAVIFPSVINDLANIVGVGRGADLLLYAFIVVFVGNALATVRRQRAQDLQITRLAREIALRNPEYPETRS